MSELENRLIVVCEENGLPVPEFNVRLGRFVVDALWGGDMVIAELDGVAAHGTVSARERDNARDIELRALGYEVLRYTWEQLTRSPDTVVADLRRALGITG